MMESDKWAG